MDFDQPLQSEASLVRDFAQIGIASGMTLMVHSSLAAIGHVIGGAPAVVRALTSALGDAGTLAMPAATPYLHDPADWPEPRPPDASFEMIREHLPEFDSATTPSAMGAIAEAFRTRPGTLRSIHPTSSVCARGPHARAITETHSLEFSEGAGTPFEMLADLDSRTLLLGVGFNRCTFLHYAESRCRNRRTTVRRNLWREHGRRVWIEMAEMADDNDTLFPRAGEAFLASGQGREGDVGTAASCFFATRELVTFATDFFDEVL